MTKHEQDMARCAAKIKALQDYVDYLECLYYDFSSLPSNLFIQRQKLCAAIAATNKAITNQNEPDTPAS